jgi:hypothetical protein
MPQPSVPSASVLSNAATPARATTPPARRAIYRWIDERGVANFTDQLHAIPERYRAQVRPIIVE